MPMPPLEKISLQIRIIREFQGKVKKGENIKKNVRFFDGQMVYNKGKDWRNGEKDLKKGAISGFFIVTILPFCFINWL